ncbi:hypothetical protein GG344DRAFT_84495 [Lentinula edodes]|nr:hypothetical protein GG344DRAFT_84495 [Lentinula edodes]
MARRSSHSLHALYTSRRSRLPLPADGPGFLYAFVDSDVYWKVGMTSDYDRRKAELYGAGKLHTFYWNIGASADLASTVLIVRTVHVSIHTLIHAVLQRFQGTH